MKMLSLISFVGACITWPILFPVNATGGGGQKQLDLLSFSNVANPNRYYAHVLIAWIYLGFIVFVVFRETVYFIGLRQAYFLSTFHAQRMSSRTVLFLDVPESYLKEEQLRNLLGPHVRKVWLVPNCDDLEDLTEDRDKLWQKFEQAQQELIANSFKQSKKSEKSESGDVYRFVDKKKRPTHRLKPVIGTKVDTIDYGRAELPEMNKSIAQKQADVFAGKAEFTSAAFVEFSSQGAAQEAMQLKAKDKKTEFSPRYIGVQPEEVIWKNLSMSKVQRKLRMTIATAAITALTIFWAIPVAFVGILTNINYLTENVPFLAFIDDIPGVILGVITGLLPAILLAVLMALVPIICRFLAKLAGAPTLSVVELKTQSWYFVFQVIQVFLVTTFTSGAAAVASQIVSNPTSAVSLLAENLPKASNFYISYFVLQGLMMAALQILNLVPFLLINILGKIMDKTPRKQYNRWTTLVGLAWGSFYPRFTNLGVIAITYSCIAPLVLGFAAIGFYLIYLGFRYNFFFVYGIKVDMKGENYPKALNQLLTGVHLASLCLIGLFAIGAADSTSSVGPLVLMIIFWVAVIVFQVLMNIALKPLVHNLPLDLLANNRDSVMLGDNEAEEGTAGEKTPWTAPSVEERKPNLLTRWIKPRVYKTYGETQGLLSGSEAANFRPQYTAADVDSAYQHPALATEHKPVVWLARDEGIGLSSALVRENKEAGIDSTDESAWLNAKGKVEWANEHPEKAPIWEERKFW